MPPPNTVSNDQMMSSGLNGTYMDHGAPNPTKGGTEHRTPDITQRGDGSLIYDFPGSIDNGKLHSGHGNIADFC